MFGSTPELELAGTVNGMSRHSSQRRVPNLSSKLFLHQDEFGYNCHSETRGLDSVVSKLIKMGTNTIINDDAEVHLKKQSDYYFLILVLHPQMQHYPASSEGCWAHRVGVPISFASSFSLG
mmetsp:Transcript_26044/g.71427  ORF Transcript_26044/g.71427 Transcript_26044/m.71427 type:complete len:121 (-) Transcript_26044:926-1288(-)